jgi:hypothetical protein
MKVTGKKYYHKEGSIKQINAYLKSLKIGEFALDVELIPFIEQVGVDYYDFDGYADSFDRGVSVSFEHHNGLFEVFVTKYKIIGEDE